VSAIDGPSWFGATTPDRQPVAPLAKPAAPGRVRNRFHALAC
jgi:hypothetical protein